MIRRLWPLALLAIALPAAQASAVTPKEGRARAVRAYRALQRNYYLTDQRIYRGADNSYLWPFSQALGATISVAGLRYHQHGAMQAAVRDLEQARKLTKDPALKAAIERAAPGPRGLKIGEVAPEVAGFDLDGVPFRLSDYRGKVVVLDFWGDW